MQKVKELVDLQDVLLRHEALESFAPEGGALATRRATNGDVRAVMLPIINTMEAPGAWAKLQEFKYAVLRESPVHFPCPW